MYNLLHPVALATNRKDSNMLRTAIEITFLAATSHRPDRLVASTMSARPVRATSTFFSVTADEDDARYLIALEALLSRLGDGWGEASEWIAGATDEGRVYVRR
jgi:hypothetical protein